MMDSTPDGAPYQLASYQKHPKKARTTQDEQEANQTKTETSLRITFKKPLKTGTEINVAANVKLWMDTMMKADTTIDVLGFDRQAVFQPAKHNFPSKEDKFKQFFLLHETSNNPALKNQITIGCILRSTRSISEIKNTTVDNGTFIDWLDKHRIFLEADHLGHENTKVIGFLLKVHPRIVHRDALKDALISHLQDLTIDPQQVIDLDKSAADHYQQAMDSGDHIATYVPPFELFSTVISHTHDSNKVSTQTLGIKCSAVHHKLLRELLSQFFTKPTSDLAHIQFSLSGVVSIIGIEAYRNLIRDNNKHFNNIATVPVVGITNAHLDIDISIADPTNPNRRMTLREIFMDTPWCHNLETTKTDGRILIVTSKANVQDARAWIDSNLDPLFTRFLPTNPRFQPHTEYAVPIRTDRIQTTTTTTNYAAKLASSIPNTIHVGKDKDKFSKFPTKPNNKHPKYSFDDTQFPKLLNKDNSNLPKTTTSTKQNTGNNITRTTKASNKNNPPSITTNEHTTLHDQTQQDLAEKFMNMMQANLQTTLSNFRQDMQQDLRLSLTKIDNRYDNLSQQVETLSKQYQHLNQIISNLQATHPSSPNGEDGHA